MNVSNNCETLSGALPQRSGVSFQVLTGLCRDRPELFAIQVPMLWFRSQHGSLVLQANFSVATKKPATCIPDQQPRKMAPRCSPSRKVPLVPIVRLSCGATVDHFAARAAATSHTLRRVLFRISVRVTSIVCVSIV